jgi:hypothetical protein
MDLESSKQEEIQVAEKQTQENATVESTAVENAENSTDVVATETTTETKDESNAENIPQSTSTETAPAVDEKKPETIADEKKDETKKIDDALNPNIEKDEDDTTIESDIDSDFDNIEEIDPSWGIDSSLWQKVQDLSTVELKPAPEKGPDGQPLEPKKEKKKEEVVEEEDSGYSELVVIRSEKERDQEFREYIRELCRPQIVSYLPDRNAPKGSDVRLTCTVKGNNVQARWLKNGETLEKSQKVQTRTDGEIHILELTSISDREAGEYTAVFKNRAGEVETTSTVKVYDGKLHKPDHLDIAIIKGN